MLVAAAAVQRGIKRCRFRARGGRRYDGPYVSRGVSRHSLLNNYMAASFTTEAGGHGSTVITEALTANQQPQVLQEFCWSDPSLRLDHKHSSRAPRELAPTGTPSARTHAAHTSKQVKDCHPQNRRLKVRGGHRRNTPQFAGTRIMQ
jgi:hypothetical protein